MKAEYGGWGRYQHREYHLNSQEKLFGKRKILERGDGMGKSFFSL